MKEQSFLIQFLFNRLNQRYCDWKTDITLKTNCIEPSYWKIFFQKGPRAVWDRVYFSAFVTTLQIDQMNVWRGID